MTRKYYLKHKKRLLAKSRLRYQKNKKRHLRWCRAWRKKNPARLKFLRLREYRVKKKQIRKAARLWYRKNKLRASITAKRYRTRASFKSWHKQHPEYMKNLQLQYYYGITIKEFSVLRKSQGNCCAICKKRFTKTPFVDHNHKTGVVRGLLCRICNAGLGMFKDVPSICRAAAKYLEDAA